MGVPPIPCPHRCAVVLLFADLGPPVVFQG
jgi:hypothetical protein